MYVPPGQPKTQSQIASATTVFHTQQIITTPWLHLLNNSDPLPQSTAFFTNSAEEELSNRTKHLGCTLH